MFSERDKILAYEFIQKNMPDVSQRLDDLDVAWATEASYNAVIEGAVLFWGTMKEEVGLLELEYKEKYPASKRVTKLAHDLLVSLYELYDNVRRFELSAKDNELFKAAVSMRHYLTHGHTGKQPWYIRLDREGARFDWALGVDIAFLISELGQTAMRMQDKNKPFIIETAKSGERYVNINFILEEAIFFLESEYELITSTLSGRVDDHIDFLVSDLDLPEPYSKVIRHLIDEHIKEDAKREHLAKENADMPRVVPPDEDDE